MSEAEVNYEHRLTSVEKMAGSNRHRLDSLEKRQDDLERLTTSVAVMAQEQECIKSDVQDIKKDVRSLTDKPGRRWESITDKLVWAICAAVLAFLLGRLGL